MYFSNELQLVLFLIPTFTFIYKNTYRKVLIISIVLVCVGVGFIPTLYMSLKNNINAYPSYFEHGFNDLFPRIYFRVPPFILGVVYAIIKFEYKYVDKLNDGTKPPHKKVLDKIRDNFHL
jgi:hypothetical protein